MRAPQHWNVYPNLRETPDYLRSFSYSPSCEGFIRRLYVRSGGAYVGVGYLCDRCYEIHFDDDPFEEGYSDLDADLHPEDFV
jgi:hypothetical protein